MIPKHLLAQVQTCFNEKRPEDAVRLLEEARTHKQQFDKDGSLSFLLGRIHFYRNDYANARRCFIAALKADSVHAYAQFLLARALDSQGEEQEALRLYASCLTARPDLIQVSDFANEIILRREFASPDLAFLNDRRPAAPRAGDAPLVSVIILCYNKLEYTERCLASLFANTGGPSFEVIVLDNASVDDTPAFLETWSSRITYLHSDVNLGFVGGNNRAVDSARGEYVLFLNNDTEVTQGWLTELLACFQKHPDAGAVGAKLVYPDGTLQEAGGIIFRDGSGWNYGRGGSPGHSLYSFVRETDYCSGAALIVRKDLFLRLGGFDERFAPAYYEDTDLCFGIRKLGYRVLFCPSSVVVHHEGATAGTSVTAGFKKHQALNAPKFRAKWAKELALQSPKDPHLVHQFSDRASGKRVLIIDDLPPLPDRAAGSLRMYHTVREMLNLGCRVTYVHLMGRDLDEAAQAHLKEFRDRGVEFIWFEYETWWEFRNSGNARSLHERLVKDLELPLRKFDLAYICFWHIAEYFIDLIRKDDPGLPVVVDSMDLHYLREARMAEVKNDAALRQKARETKKKELALYARADAVTTVTLEDRAALRKDLPDKPVFIMTDVHDPRDRTPGFDEREGLVFVGNFNHNPNEDAVLYFVNDVLPLIRRELPDVKVYIVGNNPTEKVKALSSESVVVTGWVPSVTPYLDKCRIEVVPLRYGAGNKGKVGEALAHGIPMVMTSIGAEGMKIADGRQAFIADDAALFAKRVVELYRDRETWDTFAETGKRHVASMYSSRLKRRRIEYLLTFGSRKAFRSHKALSFPLPPEATVILAGDDPGAWGKQVEALNAVHDIRHEVVLAPAAGAVAKARSFIERHPDVRMSDEEFLSDAESINRGLVNALADTIVISLDGSVPTAKLLAEIVKPTAPSGISAQQAKNGRLSVVILSSEVVEKIGGLDERHRDLHETLADLLSRARRAGITCVADSPSPLAGPPAQESFSRFPISRDRFIESYERFALLKDAPDRGLAALFRAVHFFHHPGGRSRTVEFPDVLNEIDRLTGSSPDEVVHNYASSADRTAALGCAEYLYERERYAEAQRVIDALPEATSENPSWSARKRDALASALRIRTQPPGLTSIVILTLNELACTRECVASIERHTPEPHELIFVDNGSKDGTVAWLRELVSARENCRLIDNATNLGFAKGCNQGIEASSGEYVLLLNNDVVVTPGWLGGMLECLTESPDAGVVGPMTNEISGSQRVPAVGYRDMSGLDAYAAAFRESNRHRRVTSRRIAGFCMLFRRDLISSVGLLDERFGSGNFEDDDFCLRAAIEGFRNVICGDVFIHHHGSRSFTGNRIDRDAAMARNQRLFIEKWNSAQAGPKLVVAHALEQAREFWLRGEPDQAVGPVLRAIGHAAGDGSLYTLLAEVLIDAKRFTDAAEVLEQMPDGSGEERKYGLLGLCADGLGNIDEARDHADHVLALNSRSALGLNLRGIAAYKQGEKHEATEWFKKAIASDPSYGESYTNLGVLLWSEGKRDESLDLLEKGFILAPLLSDVVAAYQSAFTEFRAFERAEGVVAGARALHPRSKRLCCMMIDLLMNAGKNEEALAALERAMLDYGAEGLLPFALDLREKVGPVTPEKTGRKPPLSLCMIVKNEEAHLARCIASVKPVVDEIVVVDTGSSDRTRDIARAFGARVYDAPWTGDFSAARNVSLDHAAGDWVLVLDADETIAARDLSGLRAAVEKNGKPAAWNMTTRNYVRSVHIAGWNANAGLYPDEEQGSGWFPSRKVRLFPRDGRVRFAGAVHELVEPSLAKAGIALKDCPVPVHHYGKLDEEKTKAKGEGYLELGRKKLNGSHDEAAIAELAVQAQSLGRFSEARDLWRSIVDRRSDDADAWGNLASAHLELGEYTEALEAVRKARSLAPASREIAYNSAIAELHAGDGHRAVETLEALRRDAPDYPAAAVMLAAAWCCTGQQERAADLFRSFRDYDFGFAAALARLARNLISAGREGYAANLLAAARETGNVNNEIEKMSQGLEQEETKLQIPGTKY